MLVPGFRPDGVLRRPRGPALCLALLLAVLVPFVHAHPPDQIWTAGLYDGGDLDEIAESVAAESGIARTPVPLEKPAVAARVVRRSSVPSFAVSPSSPTQDRAPPSRPADLRSQPAL